MKYDRPIPVPDDATSGFWTAARKHRLAFQQCQHCKTFSHPPTQFCKSCSNLDNPLFEFVPVSGKAKIVNWTVMHDSMVKGFEPPWAIVLAEFPEQAQLFYVAMLVESDMRDLKIGAEVDTVFHDINAEISLPCYKLRT